MKLVKVGPISIQFYYKDRQNSLGVERLGLIIVVSM
jgi:hypothetical protein